MPGPRWALPRATGCALLLLAALVAGGCSGYVGRAHRDYDQGRYLEVDEVLADHEDDVEYASSRGKVEYGVYRGAALAMLGDSAGARRWLDYARAVERESPGSLRPEVRAVLERTQWQLAQPPARAP